MQEKYQNYTTFTKITDFARTRLTKIFKKHGIDNASLISNWDKIVGEDICQVVIPFKIEQQFIKGKNRKILVLMVADAAQSVLVSYQKGIYLSKIHQLFGKKFVDDIKIIQYVYSE